MKDSTAFRIWWITTLLTVVFMIVFMHEPWYVVIVASAIMGYCVSGACIAIAEIIRRKRLGIDQFATLMQSEKEVKASMLVDMQFGHHKGIEGAFKEFNDIFRNYPQWHLEDWEVFRAWYKHQIDHMVQHPDIYGLKMKDGSPYSKEKDNLYDPDAPDWEQFDRIHYHDE
jgi:hypothetical protein